MRTQGSLFGVMAVVLAAVSTGPAGAQQGAANGEWRAFGADIGATYGSGTVS